MPRFSDDWVVDRTLFEYVSGGSCACCGFPHLFPDGTAGLINSISDLETDAAQAEVSALQQSPWPTEMRNQVWGDRVRLRHKLKKEMPRYKQFWEQHGEDFQHWCREGVRTKTLSKMLQIPRGEIMERVNSQYNIHSAFGVVLCAVVEQVVHFEATKYPTDARGETETIFEIAMTYDRRAGFTLKDFLNSDKTLNEEVLNIWLERMKSLGGPKLLERGLSTSQTAYNDDEDADGGGAADGVQELDPEATKPGPSFRADRRIVRLIIARYWADQFMKKFLVSKQKSETEANDQQKELAEVTPKEDSAASTDNK